MLFVQFIVRPTNTQHNINNIFYIVSSATCFDASASSSGGLNLVLCWSYKTVGIIIFITHILPAYQKHQYRTVQIVYAATKQQQLHFIDILDILSYTNDQHEHFDLLLLLSCNFNHSNNFVSLLKHKFKTPCSWCRCTETCSSAYNI